MVAPFSSIAGHREFSAGFDQALKLVSLLFFHLGCKRPFGYFLSILWYLSGLCWDV